MFIIYPLVHSENVKDVKLAIDEIKKLIKIVKNDQDRYDYIQSLLHYAVDIKQVLTLYGRIPTRNRIIGRSNSAMEEEFIKGVESGEY